MHKEENKQHCYVVSDSATSIVVVYFLICEAWPSLLHNGARQGLYLHSIYGFVFFKWQRPVMASFCQLYVSLNKHKCSLFCKTIGKAVSSSVEKCVFSLLAFLTSAKRTPYPFAFVLFLYSWHDRKTMLKAAFADFFVERVNKLGHKRFSQTT